MEFTSAIQVSSSGFYEKANGKPRAEVLAALNAGRMNGLFNGRRAKANYDAARDTAQYQRHWSNADALDADSANSMGVRHKLYHRSRYEANSNGIYDGVLSTHTNSVVGIGPKLRMLTKNRAFNQLIEREFFTWSERVGLRRKLWCMGHARYQDGEGFMVLQTNPMITEGVSLDLMPIEAEQCSTPYLPTMEVGYIDGIKFDDFNNILWYDVLPFHPGATMQWMYQKPIQVRPRDMLHWFKLKRPGAHRGKPACTSSLNLGADSRRFREATIAKAETQSDFTVMLESEFDGDTAAQGTEYTMDAFEIEKRMAVTMPNGLKAKQLSNDTPNAEYEDFTRCQDRELGAPIQQPVNVVQKDSSKYSFASGKLDTLMYGVEADVERADCDELVMNKIFASWFAEWSLLNRDRVVPEADMGPVHQWDWPAKPVIDQVAEARANDTELKNGSLTLREVHSRKGKDYEDELLVMAEDVFGENPSEENIKTMRKINLLRNLPAHVLPYVTELLDIPLPAASQPQSAPTQGVEFKVAAALEDIQDALASLASQSQAAGGRINGHH